MGMWTWGPVLTEFEKKNPKSKFNFVSISSLELTHLTSDDSDVKEKEFLKM